MEFRVLGPLEVVVEGRVLALGGTKQRALLAILVLDANRIVSADRLIDDLWGDEAADGAAHTLQVYVSQLRKALRTEGSPPTDAFLVRQGTGYVLRVEPGSVDLQHFEEIAGEGRRALAAGEPERAAEILREALGLWRGPPLPEFAHEAFAQPAIARIEDLWLSVVEDRIEADLALGGHTELVGELQTLVTEHPLRERLRGYLMLALYRSGRQAEALQVYRDARQLLADELGIDPSPDLQRLERAILEQDQELDVARASVWHRARPTRTWSGWRLLGVVLFAAVGLVAGATAVVVAGGSDARPPVSSVEANNVGRIDPGSGEVVAAIPTAGTAPTAVAWFDGSLWVANTVSRTVARINPEAERVVQTVPTEGAPTGLAAGDGFVWVLNGLHGKVQAIDPRTNEVATSIDVPAGSGGIAFGAGAVWVTNTLDASVTRINPQTRQIDDTISLGEGDTSPKAVAASDDSLWVGDDLRPIVLQIDTETGEVLATSGLRAVPTEIAIGRDGTVWVTSYDADLVSVLDPDTHQATTVRVGRGPMGLAVGDEGVWVVGSGAGTVSRIDPGSRQVVVTIRTGPIPDQVALGGGSVWVSVHA